jgi:phosphotransferase system enzyme I (PtsI)
MMIKGNPVSPGIALGKAYVYEPFVPKVMEILCSAEEAAAEKKRLDDGVQAACAELDASIERLFGDAADVLRAHKEMLLDEELLETMSESVLVEHKNASWAAVSAFGDFMAILSQAGDPLIAARTADLKDVRDRLLRVLQGMPEKNLSALTEPIVIITRDLTPSDTATMRREYVLGIISETGGSTSHAAIIANHYGVPAILGAEGAWDAIGDGVTVGLDALSGDIYISPSADVIHMLHEKQSAYAAKALAEAAYRDKSCQTADGERIQIGLNIGSDMPDGNYAQADFVGLFRTEFLYMRGDHLPTEDEQFIAYKRVLELADGKPLTLRTLDIGGDKTLSYLPLPKEENPFLGNRALRLCLCKPELFRVQIRAALRAALFGDLWLMLPMVGSIDDIRRGKAFLDETREELKAEKVLFGDVKFGIMIEIPSIAAIADKAAQMVDFASVGTNDLCQYLCAADRMNPATEAYYQTFSPAMARTLGAIAAAFHNAGKPVSICGELAGDPLGAVLLAGLGIRKLSMSGTKMTRVKAAIAQVTALQACELARQACNADTETDVIKILTSAIR